MWRWNRRIIPMMQMMQLVYCNCVTPSRWTILALNFRFKDWYCLVNIQKAMERSTIFKGKIHYKGSFSIAMLVHQRVLTSMSRGWAAAFSCDVGMTPVGLDLASPSLHVFPPVWRRTYMADQFVQQWHLYSFCLTKSGIKMNQVPESLQYTWFFSHMLGKVIHHNCWWWSDAKNLCGRWWFDGSIS